MIGYCEACQATKLTVLLTGQRMWYYELTRVQAWRGRRSQRGQRSAAADAAAAAELQQQRSRLQRALGADSGADAALAHAAGPPDGGEGAEDDGLWGAAGDLGYLDPPALDEAAQREWQAFVEKSRAVAVRPWPASSRPRACSIVKGL